MGTLAKECVIDRETREIEEYGEEVLFAGWNPQLALARENPLARTGRYFKLPADLGEKDCDAFLKRMHECQ